MHPDNIGRNTFFLNKWFPLYSKHLSNAQPKERSHCNENEKQWVPCLCTLIYYGVYYVNIEVVHITIALFKGLPKNAVQAIFPVTQSKKKTFHWTERRNTLHSSNELSFCFLLVNTPVLL